ncbi:MAG: aminoacyl-tRNA hydrolase [Armatimonadota bacterium]|nr:aminoacyl-tRNA hydrolase [Armatimonadota bacterium]
MGEKLVVGLGNPGRAYAGTRHNLGFEVVDLLATVKKIPVRTEEGWAILGRGAIDGCSVILAKPQTYVNLSGIAVADLCKRYTVDPMDLIVIHDDLDLPVGVIRIRTRGGHGGHKGVRSILESLGTDLFTRVKIGIGRPPKDVDPADYVLSPIPTEEAPLLQEAVRRAAEAVEVILTRGVAVAMNRFNSL